MQLPPSVPGGGGASAVNAIRNNAGRDGGRAPSRGANGGRAPSRGGNGGRAPSRGGNAGRAPSRGNGGGRAPSRGGNKQRRRQMREKEREREERLDRVKDNGDNGGGSGGGASSRTMPALEASGRWGEAAPKSGDKGGEVRKGSAQSSQSGMLRAEKLHGRDVARAEAQSLKEGQSRYDAAVAGAGAAAHAHSQAVPAVLAGGTYAPVGRAGEPRWATRVPLRVVAPRNDL